MVGTIKLFEILKTRFSDEDARFVVEEMEKIETGVETKVEHVFDRKKDILATKFDVVNLKEELKVDLASMRIEMERGFKDNLKWTVGTIIASAAIIVALTKLL